MKKYLKEQHVFHTLLIHYMHLWIVFMDSTVYENGDTLWRQVGQGMFGAINLTKQVTRQTKCRVYYNSLKKKGGGHQQMGSPGN